jgi:hypothetical protein
MAHTWPQANRFSERLINKCMKHTHHIVPKHMGGSDDPNNLTELTIEEHAEAHRKLYEQHGRWQDKVAWQGLLGLIPHEQIMREMYDARKGQGNHFYGRKHSEESKHKMRENRKGKGTNKRSLETCKKISLATSGKNNPMYGKTPWNKGKIGAQPKSLESKMKVSKPVIYNGVEYWSIEEAARANNTTRYFILKQTSLAK